MYVYVYIYIYIYISTCVYIYIYIYIYHWPAKGEPQKGNAQKGTMSLLRACSVTSCCGCCWTVVNVTCNRIRYPHVTAHTCPWTGRRLSFWRGEDKVGNPHRAQIARFELFELNFFELILLLKLDKHLPVEQFEAAVSQSTVPSPPLKVARAEDASCKHNMI